MGGCGPVPAVQQPNVCVCGHYYEINKSLFVSADKKVNNLFYSSKELR